MTSSSPRPRYYVKLNRASRLWEVRCLAGCGDTVVSAGPHEQLARDEAERLDKFSSSSQHQN
jgi:hypothetical protein